MTCRLTLTLTLVNLNKLTLIQLISTRPWPQQLGQSGAGPVHGRPWPSPSLAGYGCAAAALEVVEQEEHVQL